MGLNLEKALARERRRSQDQTAEETLAAFKALLRADDVQDETILQNIFGGGTRQSMALDLKKLDPERIYHVADIKQLCTRYRLRFLDASLFKGEIPYEAIAAIKQLQKDQNQELQGYKMIAPAPMFHLENKDKDPLLMLPLGNDRYYLVYRWGNDLHPLRALMVYPFRSFKTLLSSIALLAALVVSLFPDSMIMGPLDEHSWNIRIIFFFYLFLAFSGLTALYGFSRMKNFNSELWNSRYVD